MFEYTSETINSSRRKRRSEQIQRENDIGRDNQVVR